ncbi:CysB family HTH-type transcriptional regulator [Ectothiorhodospira lacustris]|uniref:CysB family HTH-type transcriptional regulator n=1 Tax=Ectothiorhodospira lacustris TaxID=2899127 RepID=UPI001EE942CA|nr:CysB family HTH-type transcriptional regulator [Ectothiorhodospira lacustris]MCG5500270.1 CysB family HTH-type transcriptional regulator [Ectothiorhodospira lacustris]
MNFQQLRIISETAKRDFNLTEVAAALYTSQSGVSKHIKDLEEELGVQIFERKGKRLLGLTQPGRELLQIVERMLLDTRNIKSLAERFSNCEQGQLTVVTTHTQACYALPRVVLAFKEVYPEVHLTLNQCGPGEIKRMLLEGRADIGIATEALADVTELYSFPYYNWQHAIVIPAGHELESRPALSLGDIARYPILTYHEGITGRARIDRTFAGGGLTPNIVMSSLDADVIKTYVGLGLGIGIVAPMAFDPARDAGLKLLSGSRLFETNTTRIAVRRGRYLRAYAYRFIELCFAHLDTRSVELHSPPPSAADIQANSIQHQPGLSEPA